MVGMAAMVGAATGGPLTEILILFEMTGEYRVMLPLMLTSVTAILVYPSTYLAAPSEHARHWDLDPAVTFLNHGSFGACPREVLAAQAEWRQRLSPRWGAVAFAGLGTVSPDFGRWGETLPSAGVGRRCELHGEHDGVLVMDDYGHHPTEITATMDVARAQERPVAALFQPHRYSRTRHFAAEFAEVRIAQAARDLVAGLAAGARGRVV